MRFTKKQNSELGARRLREKFLWLPMAINQEVRWLESAVWEEEYNKHVETRLLGPEVVTKWRPIKWL